MQIIKTTEQLRENQIFQESLRLINLERNSDSHLLESALDGRTKSAENLVKLWILVRQAYGASISLPSDRCCHSELRYWELIAEFLRADNWSEERLRILFEGPKATPGTPSIFDVLEE